MSLENNYQTIVNDIDGICSENSIVHEKVNLVAVSKTHPVEMVVEIASYGQKHFGENYLQEALEKINSPELSEQELVWHFIGHIQSNKTALIAENFDWVHSVDRFKIARRLSDQRGSDKKPLNIFLQVNLEDEASKSGFTEKELLASLDKLKALPNIVIKGLMAIPKAHKEFEKQKEVFAQIRQLNEKCQKVIPSMTELSMGMTNDMHAAIIEGASFVRVGTAIFGKRDYSA